MTVATVILARGGSKGIPNKNLIEFCGHPLISWTIRQVQEAGVCDEVWVSSDCSDILDVAQSYDALPIPRPAEFSHDTATSESAWLHAIEIIARHSSSISPDFIVAPQVTSPIRHPSDFSSALHEVMRQQADSLLSVSPVEDRFLWKLEDNDCVPINYDPKNRFRRQDLDKTFLENGSFYIFKADNFLKEKVRVFGRMIFFEMDPYKSFQIDNKNDLELCSIVMRGYGLDKLI